MSSMLLRVWKGAILTVFLLNENTRRLTGLKSCSRAGYKETEAFLSKEELLATALTKDRRSGKHSVCNALFHKTDFNTVSLGGYGCLVIFWHFVMRCLAM